MLRYRNGGPPRALCPFAVGTGLLTQSGIGSLWPDAVWDERRITLQGQYGSHNFILCIRIR